MLTLLITGTNPQSIRRNETHRPTSALCIKVQYGKKRRNSFGLPVLILN